MPRPFTVLWPSTPAPEIDEIRFSYEFCRKISRRFCEKAYPDALWMDYDGFEHMARLLNRTEGEILILVRDPELCLSPRAIQIFLDFARNGHDVCGPVYNQSVSSAQTAPLPAAYVDMETFLEVAEITFETESHGALQTDLLDPACISFRLDFLKGPGAATDPVATLKYPTRHRPQPLTVAKGALVHAGFLNCFISEREDLVALVPKGITRVLDVGCAMGGYGKKLKAIHPNIFLTGVELNPLMAKAAARVYDEIVNVPLEKARFSMKFDLINCGDILEHLVDPWGMMKRFHGLLAEKGQMVLSIPNVGHWSVSRALLKGKFQYIPLGILCIGHLRWFTESSIRESLEEAGFAVDVFDRQQIPPTPKGSIFIRQMCDAGYGDEESLKTNEFIIRAVKNPNGETLLKTK